VKAPITIDFTCSGCWRIWRVGVHDVALPVVNHLPEDSTIVDWDELLMPCCLHTQVEGAPRTGK
jgi:hypothetical protein